jgi:RimJ/RimL family protein N-acetyltransferase
MSREVLERYWPLAGLVVRTPRVELRWPDDDDLIALAELAAKGVHDPERMPFMVPWTRREPGGDLERGTLQWHWGQRGAWTPESWHFNPVTVVDGEIVGMQGMHADGFAVTRVVATGSWLGLAHQGKGIGTEMRAAMLHLAFAGLGAERAETGAFEDNPSSLGVTAKLGYVPNGYRVHDREGSAARELRFIMDRAGWEGRRRDDIEIIGLEPCLPLFGLGPPTG